MSVPETLDTERLHFRRPRLDDAGWMFDSYASDADVTRHLHWSPHRDEEETREFLRRCLRVWEDGSAHPWVLELRASATPIGMIEIRDCPPRVDVGYVLAPVHQGKGYMTEAVNRLKEWALARPEIHRFWAIVAVDNPASQRVLERAGLTREGILRSWESHGGPDGAPVDVVSYAVVKTAG